MIASRLLLLPERGTKQIGRSLTLSAALAACPLHGFPVWKWREEGAEVEVPSDLELLLDGLFPLDGSAPIWMEITTSSPVKHDSLV